MTVEDITNNENKNASEELIDMIDSFVMTYKVTTEERDKQVKAIIDKGRAEELSDKQIRELIEVSLRKHGISDRTIRRALPDELKNINMIREHKPLSLSTSGTAIDRVEQSASDTDMVVDNTDIGDQPVYREPDLVAPVLGDKTLTQVLEDKNDDVREQSFTTADNYHTMNVPVPVADYTVTTQLEIHNGTGNNIGQFTTDITVHCSPKDKTVTVEPIDKSSIVKVR